MKKAKQAFEEHIATDDFRYVCQADSVKYLELCDKYSIGWLRKQGLRSASVGA